MIIAILTDLHLGLRQYSLKERENDFYDQYNMAIDSILSKGVDVVIIAGDIFDQPRPSPVALKTFSDGIRRLTNEGIFVCNIIGNHTMINANDFTTADEFLVTVFHQYMLLDSKNIFIENGVGIFGLPYYYDHDIDKFIEEVEKLNQKAKSSKTKINILVLHQAFSEYCGFSGAELSIKDIDISNFDLIVCGHIHERKLIEIDDSTVFLQPGSLERLSVAEAKDEENNGKGIYFIDTDKLDLFSIADGFYRLDNPRKFLIADFYINNDDDINDMKGDILEGVNEYSVPPLLFLTVHDKTNSYHKIMDMTLEFKNIFLTVRFNYFDESENANDIVIDKNDVPTPREALKLALNPLDKEQATLGLEVYDILVKGEDPSDLLEDYRKKVYQEFFVETHDHYTDEEIDEILDWLEEK